MAIAERAQPVVAAAYPAPGSSRRGRLRRLDGASDDDESAEAFDPQHDVEPASHRGPWQIDDPEMATTE
jgi:hypothetical protein